MELVVTDTGVGIPADELPRIFDRFHRIEGQVGRTMEGTGIGLALVSELVRLHGGRSRCRATWRGHQCACAAARRMRICRPSTYRRIAAAHAGGHRRGIVRRRGDALAAAGRARAATWMPACSSPTALGRGGDLRRTRTERARILLADDNADMRDYVHASAGRDSTTSASWQTARPR